ncbi:MAG: type II toxin-antitoxin system VapC family toxin [Dehalococcoidia bacterium]
MPATERLVTFAPGELPPQRLYLDNDILVSYLFNGQPRHQAASGFLQSVLQHGLTTLYLSSLVWSEFLHTARRENFRKSLVPGTFNPDIVIRWHDPSVREEYVDSCMNALESLLQHFNWIEIPLGPEVRTSAYRLTVQYNLQPDDAIHIASALRPGVVDIASFDRAFRRVDGLYLWNDHIHTGNPGSS